MRTCVGCRERGSRDELLRVVAVEGVLVLDEHGRLPGRGARLHRSLECLDLADRRRAFQRALRLPGTLDSSGLRAALATDDRGALRMTQP